jgi:hypothetical protein
MSCQAFRQAQCDRFEWNYYDDDEASNHLRAAFNFHEFIHEKLDNYHHH